MCTFVLYMNKPTIRVASYNEFILYENVNLSPPKILLVDNAGTKKKTKKKYSLNGTLNFSHCNKRST